MQAFRNKVRFFADTALLVACVKLASLLKFSWIIGSSHAFFSAKTAIAPIIGTSGGMIMGLCVPIVSAVYALFFGKISLFILSVYHIPTIFASACWTRFRAFFTVIVPLVCMALFCGHQIGGQAYVYSFYWFIPVILELMRVESLFARAVQSSFVAHAVGSMLWLYAMPMTAAVWMELIPVVAIERLLVAAGMVVAYCVYQFIAQHARSFGALVAARFVRN